MKGKDIRVYYRLKCGKYQIALAWHSSTYNRITKKKVQEHITLFLPRIWSLHINRGLNWDKLFAHTVSHEYIHKAISDLEPQGTSAQFDNISGVISTESEKIGIGIN